MRRFMVIIETNPANGIRRNPVRKLNRFLLSVMKSFACTQNLDQLCCRATVTGSAQADIIRLLFFTGLP